MTSLLQSTKRGTTSYIRAALASLLLLFPVITFAAPRILYTDILSGPNTGGENNNGTYLTLFGRGFGVSQGSSTVTINNVPVAAYKVWSDSKIAVQPGSAVSSGPIRVIVNGQASNADISFTVRPGKIFFVALNGSDSTGVVGDISRPFRHAQTTFARSDFGPGDQLIVRGGTWTDTEPNFLSFLTVYGKGDPTNPMAFLGYPGEAVNIDIPASIATNPSAHGAFHAYNSLGGYTIANFNVNVNGGGSGCIDMAWGSQQIRIVNNDLQGMYGTSGGSACVGGNGRHFKVLGNKIHDNGGSKLYHAVYFDNQQCQGTDDIEIAYNQIYNQGGGRGIQIYHGTCTNGTGLTNVSVHHNIIHDIALDGILFGDNSQTGFVAYDNVVYNTGVVSRQMASDYLPQSPFTGGCIRFNSTQLVAQVYNNTFYNCGQVEPGAIRFDNTAVQLTLRNNLVSGAYFTGSPPPQFTSSNNLWWSSGAAPSWDTSSVNANPLFVDPSVGNFHLTNAGASISPAIDKGSSLVNAIVSTDLDGNDRPQGNGTDIGAYESIGPTLARPQVLGLQRKN